MPLVSDLKDAMREMGVKGYSGKTHMELHKMITKHAKQMGVKGFRADSESDLKRLVAIHKRMLK